MAEDLPASNVPVLGVVFYRTAAGNEPVREWLKDLKREDRKALGQDIKLGGPEHGVTR
jgi:hypothetical protein